MKPSFFRSLCALGATGLLFALSYGLPNHLAAQRGGVPEIVFGWEARIPFWAWSILPYCSLTPLYALAFFLCRSKAEQNRYLARLWTAQLAAMPFFLLLPLQFSAAKPAADSWAGMLFAAVAEFDRPYNQAPSLHVAFAWIVGRFYFFRLPERWRQAVRAWFALIALSVLTTWQHHFIDLAGGALLGALVLWLWPDGTSPLRARSAVYRRPARLYLTAALLCALPALSGGAWLWSLWATVSCLLAAAAYGGLGAAAFQKQANGSTAAAAKLLFLPYSLAALWGARCWLRTKQMPLCVPFAAGGRLYLGSLNALRPAPGRPRFQAAVDCCAEQPAPWRPPHYLCVPMLDTVPPPAADLCDAADALQNFLRQTDGTVLLCCALGLGRSAAVAMVWLLRHGGCHDWQQAWAQLQQSRPQLQLANGAREQIERAAALPAADMPEYGNNRPPGASQAA